MTYSDFVAVMLTGVTVLLAVLALFIGALAIWGYAQFERLTERASERHLEALLLADGPFPKKFEAAILQHITKLMNDGDLREFIRSRVDEILVSDASTREQENRKEETKFEG